MKTIIFQSAILFFIFFLLLSIQTQAQDLFNSQQSFIPYSSFAGTPQRAIGADLDNDSDKDVLFSNLGYIGWYENTSASFGSVRQITNSGLIDLNALQAIDLDGDGDKDVLYSFKNLFTDKIEWFENEGNGNFSDDPRLVSEEEGNVYADDLDGDGDMDLVATFFDDPADIDRVVWYANDGTGNFGSKNIITDDFNNNRFRRPRTADLDGDGDRDVYVVSYWGVKWYKNDGNGNFGSENRISSQVDRPNSANAADLDGDGDLDMVTSTSHDNRVKWFENLGGGSFGEEQTITDLVYDITGAYVGDLDGDGDIDVISSSYSDNKIAWYPNDGIGNFGNQIIVASSAMEVLNLDIVDLDGDNDLDILSNTGWDYYIAWYENDIKLELFVTVNINNAPCIGATNGSLQVQLSGLPAALTPPYSYTWSLNSGQDTGTGISQSEFFSIDNLAAGSYTIEVTNADMSVTGTASNYNIGGVAGSFFEIIDIVTTNSSNALPNGSIEITVDGGKPDYTFNWSGVTSGSASSSSLTFTIPFLQAGTYDINITDSEGFPTSHTITLLDETAPVNTCENPLDIVILNDVSGSVDAVEYAESKQFFIDFVGYLNLGTGTNDSRVAIIEWSGTEEQEVRIPITGEINKLQNYTSSNRIYHGGTNPQGALQYGYEYLANNARTDVTKILVLSTDGHDGQLSGSLIALSKQFQAEGYIVVTIAFDESFSSGYTRNILTETASIPLLAPGAPAYSQLDNTLANNIVNIYVCPSDPGSSNTVYFNRDGVLEIIDYTLISSCPNPQNIEVTFTVTAQQQLSLPPGTPITFYYNNPELFSATQILTTFVPCAIEAGASETLTVSLPISNPASIWGVLNDDGSQSPPISFPITQIPESVYLNNLDYISVCIAPIPTLTAFKYTTTPKPICDNTVIYTVDVCNVSELDAVNVKVTDQAPSGFLLQNTNENLNDCATQNNDGSFDIPAGCCASITYQYNTSNAPADNYYNQGVLLSGPNGQIYQNFVGEGISSENVTIGQGINCDSDEVLFSKTVNITQICEQSFITYTFEIDNQTNVALQGMQFRDVLPSPVIWAAEPYLLAGLSIGSTDITGRQTADFTIAEIAPQTVATFSMDAYLGDWNASGILNNTATLSDFPDFVNDNGSDLSSSSESININALPSLESQVFEIIEGDTATLSVIMNGDNLLEWTTIGGGILADYNAIATTYIPSESDIEAGFVDFTVSAESPIEGCGEASANLQLIIRDKICLGLDRTTSTSLLLPDIEALDTLTLCAGESVTLKVNTDDIEASQYRWQDGSPSPTFLVTQSGNYSVEVTDSSTCQLLSDQIFIEVQGDEDRNAFILPTAFSPNEDGINDAFRARAAFPLEVLQFDFWIYNRWGELIFQGNELEKAWTGGDNPLGVYVWYYQAEIYIDVEGCEEVQKLQVSNKGNVTLIR